MLANVHVNSMVNVPGSWDSFGDPLLFWKKNAKSTEAWRSWMIAQGTDDAIVRRFILPL